MGQNGLRVGFNGHSHIFTSPLQRQKPQMVLFFDYLLFFLIQFLIKKAEGFPSAFFQNVAAGLHAASGLGQAGHFAGAFAGAGEIPPAHIDLIERQNQFDLRGLAQKVARCLAGER